MSPPTPSEAPPRTRSSRRPPTAAELWAIRAFAAAAALIAVFSPAAPTGYRLVDALWCAALAAVVTLAASRSRRLPLIWFAGIITLGGVGSLWALAGLAGLGVAIAGVATAHRSRLLGAAGGALATITMLRMPDIGFDGFTALVSAVAVCPLLWSAYMMSPTSVRLRTRKAALIGGGVVLVVVVGFAVAAFVAEPDLRAGASNARNGLDALRDGEQQQAADLLDISARRFDTALGYLDAPWAWPARLLPVVGPHARALHAGAQAGNEIASTASLAATEAPYRQLQPSNGQVDLAAVEAMQAPVAATAEALRNAEGLLDEARSSWLVAPVADALDEMATEVSETLPEAELAEKALAVTPGLLGQDGERRYLVLFTTPSETRFLGGFAGTYGIITATDGKVSFEPSVSTGQLRAGQGERTLDQFPEFEARHGRYNLDRYFQNTTAAPDLPSNAEVTRALYEQSTGERIDGVMVIDPYAVAALLEITGPIEVEGLDEPLTADNAARYLLHEQYLDYADDNQERRDVLGAASSAMFQALLSTSLPGPAELGRVLGPLTDQGRLLFHSFDPAEQALFERLGMSGRFVTPADLSGDFVSLRTANSGANKLDWFLHRSLGYEATYDPSTGLVEATATIELRNDSPSGGLPRYIIGNIRNEPPGTNTMYLSLYSPLGFESATLDGNPVGIEVQSELGANTYSRLVSVAPGSTTTLQLKLRGVLNTGADYRLSVLNQPMVNDDQLSVTVRPATDDWHVAEARGPGITIDGSGAATASHPIGTNERFAIRFEP